MLNLKIGGVPEHFNYPWYIALKNKRFKQESINLRWKDFGGGTGAMVKALEAKEIDIAIVLTEGIIKAIIDGNSSKIVQPFVESSLIWGIHVGHDSSFQKIDELEEATCAISRFGSGSHLMAIVNAHNQGWNIDKLKFKVVGNLEGGIKALSEGEADYFMWEHFTTKPLVDNKTFRRIDDCPTPWPCFVVAVRNEVLENHKPAIEKVLSIINSITTDFKDLEDISTILSNRYEQKLEDIEKWLSITNWNDKMFTDNTLITEIQKKLVIFGVIDNAIPNENLVYNF